MASAVEVYLDTNAVSCLFHPPEGCPAAAQTRSALKRHLDTGSLTVVTSLSVFDELAGMAPAWIVKYQRTQELLWELAGSHVLRDNYDRIRLEVHQGPLSGSDRFLPRDVRRSLRLETRKPSSARAVARKRRQLTEPFAKEFEKLRTQVLADIGDDSAKKTRAWREKAPQHVDDWTVEYFRNNRQRLGLPVSEDDWPEPRQVPSAWHKTAFYLAWLKQTVGESRKIKPSDRYNIDHYVNASYVDLMVTQDGPFQATCGMIPDRPFQIETFQDFATTGLGAAA